MSTDVNVLTEQIRVKSLDEMAHDDKMYEAMDKETDVVIALELLELGKRIGTHVHVAQRLARALRVLYFAMEHIFEHNPEGDYSEGVVDPRLPIGGNEETEWIGSVVEKIRAERTKVMYEYHPEWKPRDEDQHEMEGE